MRGLVQLRRQLLLEPHVAPLGAEVVAHEVGDLRGENLPKPGGELRLGAAVKAWEVTMGLQESLLNDVGRVEFALKPPADLDAGQQAQVIAVQLEQAPQCRLAAGLGVQDHLFRIHNVLKPTGESSRLWVINKTRRSRYRPSNGAATNAAAACAG